MLFSFDHVTGVVRDEWKQGDYDLALISVTVPKGATTASDYVGALAFDIGRRGRSVPARLELGGRDRLHLTGRELVCEVCMITPKGKSPFLRLRVSTGKPTHDLPYRDGREIVIPVLMEA